MNKIFFVLAALAMLSTASCNKKEAQLENPETGNTPTEVTKANLVGAYLVTKVETSASGQRSDITASWFSNYAGECTKDDITVFNPDDSFIVQDGRIECDESTDDTGTWSLVSKTELKLDKDIAKIEELTSKTLRIVSPLYSTPQNDIIITYTRQ